jgi:hypothetical protein
MPATGDRITKRKDGLFQGMYTAQTPDGKFPLRGELPPFLLAHRWRECGQPVSSFATKASSEPPLKVLTKAPGVVG